MPKKGRKTNVAQQVKASGNRSETFAQGQRRVSTPRGRSSALQLAPQPEPQTAQRLSMYSAQSQQQVGRDLARREMDEFYQARAQGQQGQQQAFAQAKVKFKPKARISKSSSKRFQKYTSNKRSNKTNRYV